MRAVALLNELMTKHPEWNWTDLEDRGFYEIMQAYRHAPLEDQTSTVLLFTVIKEYIRYLIDLDEKRKKDLFKARNLSYRNRNMLLGYVAGMKEAELLIKRKPTYTEQSYLTLSEKFGVDVPTIALTWSFVNGHRKNKAEIVSWAKKRIQNMNHVYSLIKKRKKNVDTGDRDYYIWYARFIDKLTPEEFNLFENKKTIQQPMQVKKVSQNEPQTTTMGIHTALEQEKTQKAS